jgi:hypothetical protein
LKVNLNLKEELLKILKHLLQLKEKRRKEKYLLKVLKNKSPLKVRKRLKCKMKF